MSRDQTLRWARRGAVVVWAFSWYTVYREIFVWHHMTTGLRFNPPDVPADATTKPHAGLPLIAVCTTSVAAPLAVLVATIALRRRKLMRRS